MEYMLAAKRADEDLRRKFELDICDNREVYLADTEKLARRLEQASAEGDSLTTKNLAGLAEVLSASDLATLKAQSGHIQQYREKPAKDGKDAPADVRDGTMSPHYVIDRTCNPQGAPLST
jgi:hypothetical protein